MSLRMRTALVLLAIAGLLAAVPALAQDKFRLKPGASGKICLDCHTVFQDTVKLPFVHTPVKSGECSDCHNPHASSHGKLLAADVQAICAQCHAGIVPKDARSAHQTVAQGQCVKCHDPHASKNKASLLLAGNDLCNSCHKEIAAAVAASRFKHSPVEKSCLGCHDPHASTKAEFLLKSGVPGLCTDCHRADQPAFAREHMGYPVAKARCTSCHDPHGSLGKGLLWPSVHAPVANKMCGQCHPEPTAADSLKSKKTGIDLCRGCHNTLVDETFAKSRIHWPVVDKGSCLNCHTAHASKHTKLLADAPKVACGRCHADTLARQTKSLAKHPPSEEGNCVACHAPHASNSAFLLQNADVNNLCGTCHDWQRHSSHPIGEKVVDQRNKNLTLDCLSCHRSHGSPFKAFAYYDTKRDLCVQCHEDLKR